jgi:hypothetical protein
MIKTTGRNGTMSVTFTLAAAVDASQAAICGEWNDWSADRDIMEPTGVGFTRTVELQDGRCYRFRYLLDGHRWENDCAADAYVPNEHGSDDSLVDLTSPTDEAPAAAVEGGAETPAPETAAKQAASARRAASKKQAAPTNKAAPAEAASGQPAQPTKAVKSSQAAKKKAPAQKTTKKSTE